ncbi:uncharacterized protein [Lolium perenne]|uniref:uncharacterized protein n=1 Tax=Lolium perenne TaxID=4522 RepID=UPI0021F51B4E|nr:uncharacterized protein LOC127326774 [Lolium perenne]
MARKVAKFFEDHKKSRKDTQLMQQQLWDTCQKQKKRLKALTEAETEKDQLIAMLNEQLKCSEAQASDKAKLNDLSAKRATLEAENESMKRSLDVSHEAESKGQLELKTKSKEFEKILAEKNELVSKCQEATKTVGKELDDHLELAGRIDHEILELFNFPASWNRQTKFVKAGSSLRELIRACYAIAKHLTVHDGETCPTDQLARKMEFVPGLIEDWKKSSARGAARMALTLMKDHMPGADVDYVTSGIPNEVDGVPVDEKAAKQTVLGFFFDKGCFHYFYKQLHPASA